MAIWLVVVSCSLLNVAVITFTAVVSVLCVSKVL